jgi:hypothetical protein
VARNTTWQIVSLNPGLDHRRCHLYHEAIASRIGIDRKLALDRTWSILLGLGECTNRGDLFLDEEKEISWLFERAAFLENSGTLIFTN